MYYQVNVNIIIDVTLCRSYCKGAVTIYGWGAGVFIGDKDLSLQS